MKKRFIGLLILLLCAWVQSAYGAAGDVALINGKAITAVATVSGKANAAILTIGGKPCADGDSACGVLFEQETQNSYVLMGDSSAHIYTMTTFTPTAGSIKTVYLKGYKNGTGSVLTGYLCDSTGTPPVPDDDPSCVAADATFDTSGIGTDYSYNIKFNWTAGYTVDAAQHIFLVVDNGADATNYTRWGINNDVASNYVRHSADGTTYASDDTSAQCSMKVTSCEE
jgi:hypothetical protein